MSRLRASALVVLALTVVGCSAAAPPRPVPLPAQAVPTTEPASSAPRAAPVLAVPTGGIPSAVPAEPTPGRTKGPGTSPGRTADGGDRAGLAGNLFVDPDGHYQMMVSDDWVANHGALAEGIEVWTVPPGSRTFMPNINVLTQSVGDITLDDYLSLTARSARHIFEDGKVVSSRTVRGPAGSELGVMEYSGKHGSDALRFLGVFAIRDGRAIAATFTAPPGVYGRTKAAIEPYLLTLTAT